MYIIIIIIIAPEGLWLCTADMVCGIIHELDVLEELTNNLTRWLSLVVLQGSRRARFFHDLKKAIYTITCGWYRAHTEPTFFKDAWLISINDI